MYDRYHHINQAKRKLSIEISGDDDSKKLRTTMFDRSVTCLEDLSNELIYDILEYFTAQQIFNQFSSLNQRFQNIIYHSNMPLKMHSSTLSSFKQTSAFLSRNSHRILSIHLSNQLESAEFFSCSFNRLELLVLDQITCMEILVFLQRLAILPRLFSLKISLKNNMDNPEEIYRSIFRLPHLRYNKISASSLVLPDSSPFIANERCHSIQHLVIDHPCSLHMLYDILSCLPNLHQLNSGRLFHLDQHTLFEMPSRSFRLNRCTIRMYDVKFKEFEQFIKDLSSHLQFLHLVLSDDVTYLDADRWEQLFSKHTPFLQTLCYHYSDGFYHHHQYQPHHALIHRFTSSFWMRKRWMLNIETDITYWPSFELIYLIQPHKKMWYEFCNEERDNMDLSQTMTQLTIRGCHFQRYDQLFSEHIRFLVSLATITSLYIEIDEFSIDILISFLQRLPTLDILTLVLTNSSEITPLTQDQIEWIDAISKINQVKKVNIEQHVLLNHIDILINLCPQMQFLRIHCRNYSQMEFLLRLILMRRKSSLFSVYFVMANADESIVTQLQTLIHSEKLLEDYTMQRIGDEIALYW